MNIDIRNNTAAGRFEAQLEGNLAYAQYRLPADGVIEFFHTVVPEAFEGKGIGSALVRAGLAHAREQGLSVIPTCPFFAGYIQRHSEVQDLVHPDHRARLQIGT